jgi:hypothetical protein
MKRVQNTNSLNFLKTLGVKASKTIAAKNNAAK